MRTCDGMLSVILSWLGLTTASYAARRALDSGVNRLAPDKLSTDLAEAITEWACGLSQSGVADTLIKVLFAPLYEEPGPARIKLLKTIQEQELPSVETWFQALYERWIEVRGSDDELQPFFMLEPDAVVPALQEL